MQELGLYSGDIDEIAQRHHDVEDALEAKIITFVFYT